MKRGLKNFLTLLAVAVGFTSFAQQVPLSGLYYQNKFLVNPASAGEQDSFVAFLNHRRQWVGIEGAPVTNILSIHSPIGNGNQAVGGTFSTDRTHILQRTTGTAAYSQRFKFDEDHYLALGAGVGFIDNRINVSDLVVQDPTEIILGADDINGTTFTADLGLKYKLKGLDIGFSVPQIFETNVGYNEYGADRYFELKRHLNAYAAYNFNINDGTWMIEPSAFFRYLPGGKAQYDGNIYVNYKDLVWVGITGRSYVGVIPALGFRVAKSFSVMYSYEIATTGIGTESNGTHELMVSFRVGGGNNNLQEQIDELKNNQDTLWEKTDLIKDDVDSLKTRMDANEEGDESQQGEIDDHEKRIGELEKELEELRNAGSSDLDTNKIKDMLMRMIKKTGADGSVKWEEEPLEAGYYVVIESFREMWRAEKAVAIWKEKNVEAIIVHNKQRKWYYVYSKKYDELKPALTEMRKVRASGLQDKAWVHIYKGE